MPGHLSAAPQLPAPNDAASGAEQLPGDSPRALLGKLNAALLLLELLGHAVVGLVGLANAGIGAVGPFVAREVWWACE